MAAVIFPVYVERGCGLDVHQQTVIASIAGKGIEAQTKTFGTFTEDLYHLVGWLQKKRLQLPKSFCDPAEARTPGPQIKSLTNSLIDFSRI